MSHMPCFLLLYPAFVYSSDSILHILGCHLFVIRLNICRQVFSLHKLIRQRFLFLQHQRWISQHHNGFYVYKRVLYNLFISAASCVTCSVGLFNVLS